jgi:hypothetical protein
MTILTVFSLVVNTASNAMLSAAAVAALWHHRKRDK